MELTRITFLCLVVAAPLAAQAGTMIIKDDTTEQVIAATDNDRTFSISIRDNSPDTVVKVIIKTPGAADQFVTLEGAGDGTGVLNLPAGSYVQVQDIDPTGGSDDASISYDVH